MEEVEGAADVDLEKNCRLTSKMKNLNYNFVARRWWTSLGKLHDCLGGGQEPGDACPGRARFLILFYCGKNVLEDLKWATKII